MFTLRFSWDLWQHLRGEGKKMKNQRKSFIRAGIGIIIFILCYRLLPPPPGSSLGLRAFWLCVCPLVTSLAGLVIFGIVGLLFKSTKVFATGLSSFIVVAAILYAVICIVFPIEIKLLYTKMYLRGEKAERVAKRDNKIKKAIEKNMEKQKDIPLPVIETKPLKLVIEESPVPQNEKVAKTVIPSKTFQAPPAKKKKISTDGTGNPFNYGADELGGYIPIKGEHMLLNVSIKGIITLEDGESVAALKLQNKTRAFFVRKGNVIRLQEKNVNKKVSEIYLQVRNIKNNEVEIIQQQRPDKVIIIR